MIEYFLIVIKGVHGPMLDIDVNRIFAYPGETDLLSAWLSPQLCGCD